MNLLTDEQQRMVAELRRLCGHGTVSHNVGTDDVSQITDRLDVVIALLWDINSKLGGTKK